MAKYRKFFEIKTSNQKPDSFLKTVHKNRHLIYLFVTIIDCFSSIFIFSGSLWERVSHLLSLCWLRWLHSCGIFYSKLTNIEITHCVFVCCSKNKKIMINSLFEHIAHPPHFIQISEWNFLEYSVQFRWACARTQIDCIFFAATNTVWNS